MALLRKITFNFVLFYEFLEIIIATYLEALLLLSGDNVHLKRPYIGDIGIPKFSMDRRTRDTNVNSIIDRNKLRVGCFTLEAKLVQIQRSLCYFFGLLYVSFLSFYFVFINLERWFIADKFFGVLVRFVFLVKLAVAHRLLADVHYFISKYKYYSHI